MAAYCRGQYQQLLHKTHAERVIPMLPLYDKAWYSPDSVALFTAIETIKKMAAKAGDEDLLLETALLRANFFYNSKNIAPVEMLAMLDSLSSLAISKQAIWLQALAENLKAVYNFYYLQNYEVGLEYHGKVYNLIKNLSPEVFPYKQDCLSQIGVEHYFFKDFQKAIFYFRQALDAQSSYQRKPHPSTFSTLNSLGLCYQELGRPDSSNYFFDSTLALAVHSKSEAWEGISSGNLGYNFFLKKEYGTAMPLLDKDVKIALQQGDWGLAAGSLMVQANIGLLQNNLAAAGPKVQAARQYVYLSGQYKRLQDLYPLLSKWYAATSQPSQAAMFLDSALFVKDSLARKFNSVLLLKAQQKTERQQFNAEIALINNEKRIKTLQRNALITAVLLLFTVAAFAYSVYLRRYRQKQKDLQIAAKELESASRQLDDFTRHLLEKNGMIELLQQKMGTADPELQQRLQQSTLLTDEAWEHFATLFEKVHGGYLYRLRQKIAGLTPSETRFMALAKLNLNNKEMAASLGVGPNAIRNTWFRLRKKLNLPEEYSLKEFVKTI